MFKKRSGSTDGRTVYRRWRLGAFEYISDLISSDYMRRWQFRTPWGAMRLHHILRGDHDRHMHDHPMDFVSLIVWGGYIEHCPGLPPRKFSFGDVNAHRAEDLHRLDLTSKSTWTIVIAGPFRRDWGFQTEDGWVYASNYDAWKVKKAEQYK